VFTVDLNGYGNKKLIYKYTTNQMIKGSIQFDGDSIFYDAWISMSNNKVTLCFEKTSSTVNEYLIKNAIHYRDKQIVILDVRFPKKCNIVKFFYKGLVDWSIFQKKMFSLPSS
jgi:hypothetical protein